MHSHTAYHANLRHPVLSTVDWLHGAKVFCSCYVLFSLVYHIFDSLGVIVIICARLSAIPTCRHPRAFLICLTRSSLGCFLTPLGQETPVPHRKPLVFYVERYRYPRNVVPVCGPMCPNPIKFYQSVQVVSCSCRAGVPLPVQHYSHRHVYVRNTAFADIEKSCKR